MGGRVQEFALLGGRRSSVRGSGDPHLAQIPVRVDTRVNQREDLADPINPAGARQHRDASAVDVADSMPPTITILTDAQQHPVGRI
jgi:hypothetical protein